MMNKDVLIELMEKVRANGIRELIISHDRVEIRTGSAEHAVLTPKPENPAVHCPPVNAPLQPQPSAVKSGAGNLVEIRAPLPGTVFIAPGTDTNKKALPGKGSAIKEGEVIALVEAMKMFNDIFAPASGIIEEFHVANQSAVKVGDVIMTIRSG